MPPPVLNTERLQLRPITVADAPQVQLLAGDHRVAEMTANIPHPYPEGAAETWIGGRESLWRAGTDAVFALTLQGENELMGAISIMHIAEGSGEVGYWVGVPFWGHGYCSEALQGLLPFAYETLKLQRLTARCMARNLASRRVLEKAGFVFIEQAVDRCGEKEPEPLDYFELGAPD